MFTTKRAQTFVMLSSAEDDHVALAEGGKKWLFARECLHFSRILTMLRS